MLTTGTAQVWAPTVLTYILAAILREKETAATWSVSSRSLLSSYWPTFLRSDSSNLTGPGVRKGVLAATLASPIIAILVAIAGVVTPLGLYDALEPNGKPIAPEFAYAVDTGVHGLATGPRLNHTFTRLCGGFRFASPAPFPCPGAADPVVMSSGGGWLNTTEPFGIQTRASDDVAKVFSSGTEGARTTISNFFDIEWRQLTWVRQIPRQGNNYTYDNGTSYSVGRFQQIDSSILDSRYKVVEGLVVDAREGGLGFRNHTIPTGLPYGGRWKEDLLFIEPETECVDTNLTIDWTITTEPRNFNATKGEGIGIRDLFLTDRGGFARAVLEYPTFDRDISQKDPSLRTRAYKGAWLSNMLTAVALNITNSAGNRNYSGRFQVCQLGARQNFCPALFRRRLRRPERTLRVPEI